MAFKDIKGQAEAISFFINLINKDRLAHAYIFLGPSGIGKSLFARTLAKFLNCGHPLKHNGLSVECCDCCSSCRKIDDYNHPDVHWIQKQQKTKNISIDEIRAMQKEIFLKSYEGKFKIFVIQDAQQMSEQATHSLLKTLEEPPPASIIILTVTNITSLLPTIISRSQIVKFRSLEYKHLKQILITDYKLEPAEAHFLTIISEGRLGRALALKEKQLLSEKNRLIAQVCDSHFSSARIFNSQDKQELAGQFRHLLNWYRDILACKVGLDTTHIINVDKIEKIKSSASMISLQQLEQALVKIEQAHQLISLNVNPKLAIEVLLRSLKNARSSVN